MSVERGVKEEEVSLGFHVANCEENHIMGIAAAETINTENTITSSKFKKTESARILTKLE